VSSGQYHKKPQNKISCNVSFTQSQ